MLVQEPAPPDRPASPPRRRSPAVLVLLALAAVGVIVLRHDYWNWDTPYPLLFGFLPVGLWWQGLVSLLAAGLMWMMVRFAWPAELEMLGEGTADEGATEEGTEARRHGGTK